VSISVPTSSGWCLAVATRARTSSGLTVTTDGASDGCTIVQNSPSEILVSGKMHDRAENRELVPGLE